ncbi:MAG: presenilin family intramembrane aspartyl protease PSH [Thermoplasmataceae archaeon]|jgi:presenilin-like A22 family membrane protease|nr:presenilin family intramembrane aspartyl protease [Candidatus Thermoplasmatota archaeon]
MKKNLPEIFSIGIFIITSLFAIYVSEILDQTQPSDAAPTSSSGFQYVIFYIVIAIIFTFVVLYLARKKHIRVIKGVFIFSMAYVTFFIASIVGLVIAQTETEYLIFIVALPAVMVYLLVFRNEWYVVNISGFILSAGIAAIWGVIIGVWAAVAFLAAFAVYDYIAVYKTKHMVDLARVAVDESLPMLFVIPSKRGLKYKDMEFDRRGDGGESGESDTLMIGFGDIAFPSILVVSSALYGVSNFYAFAFLPMAGAVAGMITLYAFARRPAPGLPYINSGAILGFLIAFAFFR